MADQSDLARELLERARDDEAAGAALLPVEAVSDSVVGFHAQQAVEKALKAVLAAEGADFPFTHDLALLADLCHDAGLALPGELEEVDRLSPYAVHFRYGGKVAGTVGREDTVRWAALAIEWAEEQLESNPG